MGEGADTMGNVDTVYSIVTDNGIHVATTEREV